MEKSEALPSLTIHPGKLMICVLSVLLAAGCRVPKHIPKLTGRSVLEVNLVIETDPPEARVYGEELEELGKAPVTKTWRIEKLSWTNGETDFRLLPEGTRLELGEDLSIELTVKAEGYKKRTRMISVPFPGKTETITRKIVLKK